MRQAVKLGIGLFSAVATGMVGMWALDRHPTPSAVATAEAATAVRTVRPGAVSIELFVMSQCPYGVQTEQAFESVVEKLGADVDYHVDYIGDRGPDGALTSMHGAKEIKGDVVQSCVAKHSSRWPEFLACQNQTWHDIDTNWQACAKKIGLAPETISACADGPEGQELVAASFDRSQKRGATGSPTIYIGGTEYEGGRRVPELMRAVCQAYKGDKPAACSDIPEPPKINVTLLGDRRCGADCDLAPIEGKLRRVAANPEITKLDYGEPAGKALAESIRPAMLPAIVFDGTLDADHEALEAVSGGLREMGGHRVLSLGEWNPACVDKGGCKLDACKDTLQCRAEEPNKLEVFVMSQCPYGVKGLDAMHDVLDHFSKKGSKLDFAVHYIGDGTAKEGLSSMHGPGEVDEDIRQVCAIEHFGKDLGFMKYIWCRNPKIRDTDWKSCTGGSTGIDAAKLDACASGDEGKRLLEKSFALSKAAGADGSPTWLVNGKYKFQGIDADTIKSNVCAHNKLKGCEDAMPVAPPAAAGDAPAPGCGQ